MPQTRQAIIALRKSEKRAHRNKLIKSSLRTLVKKTRKAIEEKSKDAETLLKETIKAVDKAIQGGQLKKNTGARKKSRLTRAFNAMNKESK